MSHINAVIEVVDPKPQHFLDFEFDEYGFISVSIVVVPHTEIQNY